MNKINLIFAAMSLLVFSCNQPAENYSTADAPMEEEPVVEEITYRVDQPATVIQAVEAAAGGWDNLWALNDVEFTYTYLQPGDGKKDESNERYLFDSEHSWAKYTTHEVNVFPETPGEVIQCYDGKDKAEVMLDGEKITDEQAVGLAHFLRKANYFWFTMNFKLDNPGTIHQYLGQETVNGTTYDKVQVNYNSQVTGKPLNDTFILFVNPDTKLVDRFLFSLPDFEVMEPVLLMEVEYSQHQGLMLPTKRYAFMPDEEGNYSPEPVLVQTTSNIKFNNGFTVEDFVIE